MNARPVEIRIARCGRVAKGVFWPAESPGHEF